MSKTPPHDQLIRYRLNRAEEAYQVVNFQQNLRIDKKTKMCMI